MMIRALLIEAHGLSATRQHVAVMRVVILGGQLKTGN